MAENNDQEFIDHSLLGPEYISNNIANSFIIDLMEHQVFHKDNSCQVDITSPFDEKVSSLVPEFQIQNAIFKLTSNDGNIRNASSNQSITSNHHAQSPKRTFQSKFELKEEFLTLDASFLSDGCNKLFSSSLAQETNLSNSLSVPPLIPICNLNEIHKDNPGDELPEEEKHTLHNYSYNSQATDVTEINFSRFKAKKMLPHKKRISRKLKVAETSELQQIKHKNILVNSMKYSENGSSSQFNCELCGSLCMSQLEFFAHLKQHYEPAVAVVESELPLKVCKLQKEAFRNAICLINKKNSDVHVEEVLREGQIDFTDFNSVGKVSTEHQTESASVIKDNEDDIKILGSNEIVKCMNYVIQTDVFAENGIPASGEVEFSDTEDMLEGIRNVVDKVSIEDTCDEIDMMATNNLRNSWFANSAFKETTHKNKNLITSVNSTNITEFFTFTKDLKTTTNEDNMSLKGSELQHIKPLSSSENEFMPTEDRFIINNKCNPSIDHGFHDHRKEPKYKLARSKIANKKLKKHISKNQGVKVANEEAIQNKLFICPKCNREFNSSNALKYHGHTHTGERLHQCEVCGKSFFTQSALNSHIRMHTGDKPFKCKDCYRQFRQWGDLKYHTISIHTDEKSHQCEFCGKAFSRKYSLVIHRRIHTSERNYKCEFCPKTFRASSYLQNHRKIHTGEKPYQCEICTRKFRVSGDLRRHVKTHQRNENSLKAHSKFKRVSEQIHIVSQPP